MVIIPTRDAINGYSAVITHKGREIPFSMKYVEKTSAGTRKERDFDSPDSVPMIERIFDDINQFILSQLTNGEQDEVFRIYSEIYENISQPQILNGLVRQLFSIISLTRVHYWVSVISDIKPSKSIESAYRPGQGSHPRERTYIEADYMWLASLAVTLRAMLPIWGEWFRRTSGSQMENVWKESRAFELLNGTSLMTDGPDPSSPNTFEIYPPMEKLSMFVRGSIQFNDKLISTITVGGISTEEFPEWMLALTIVRRVSVGELKNDFNNPKKNVCLVASIYKFIDNRISQMDKTFGGPVVEKKPESNNAARGEENNLSRLEGFREREKTPPNLISRTEVFLDDIYGFHRALSRYSTIHPGEINEDMVRRSIDSVEQLRYVQPTLVQLQLIQWVSSLVISPHLIDHMHKGYILKLMTMESFLVEHGHPEIAGVLTGVPFIGDGDEFTLGSASSSNRIDAALSLRLRDLYKNARTSVQRKSGAETKSAIDECLNEASNRIKEVTWRLTMPQEFRTFEHHADTGLYAPDDVKTKLAKLAICIAERKF